MYIKSNSVSPLFYNPYSAEERISPAVYLHHKKKYLFIKRAADIVLASLVIAFILSWLIPLLGILIKRDSRGPIFFRQRRVGRGGVFFTCFKLRTMAVNAEADIRPAGANDHRITRLGKKLRHWNLDELPQFVNIFMGDMSLCGPRPHMPADCERFGLLIDDYHFRNLVRPGLTGLAQVKGFQGPAFTMDSIRCRFAWDACYIRNAGILLDLRIVGGTLATAFKTLSQRKRMVRHLHSEEIELP